MRHLRKWLGRLQNKLLALALLVGVLPMMLLGIISFSLSYHNLLQSNEKLAASNLYAVHENLKSNTRKLELLARELLWETDLSSFVRNSRTQGGLRNRAHSTLYKLVCSVDFPVSIYVFDMDGTYLLASSNMNNYTTINLLQKDIIRSSDWFEEALIQDGYESYYLSNVLSTEDETTCSTVKLLRSLSNYEPFAVAVINVSSAMFSDALRAEQAASGITCVLANIMSGETLLITGASDEKAKTTLCQQLMDKKKDDVLPFSYMWDSRSKIYSVAMVNHHDVFLSNAGIASATLSLTALLILISVIGSIAVSRSIVKPLNRLGNMIAQMENDERLSEPPFADDEVGRIGNAFLHMDVIKHQLQERLVQSLIAEKEAQIHALQSQINPHFLYNTLSSIYWLCKFGRNEDAAKVAVLLSDSFKYVMNTKDDMISVETELFNIDQYLTLQNIRFDGKIHIEKEIDERVLERKIMRFIIQPFVENALYHGLEPKMSDWLLRIEAYLEGNDIVFLIEDNGVGMEDLCCVEQGYGISNVIKRIRLKYGDQYGCQFHSVVGEGTTIQLRVPAEQEENHEESYHR